MRYRIQSAARRLADLGSTAPDYRSAQHQALQVLREQLPYDAASLGTVDPATLLWTSCVTEGVEADAHRETFLFDNEYRQNDLHKVAEIARLTPPVRRLSQVAPEVLMRSPRYQALQHMGVQDELRCALVDGGDCWGSIELYRSQESGPFTDHDGEVAAALSQPLARMIRLSLLRQASSLPASLEDPPGILVLEQDGSIDSISPDCERWIDEIDDTGPIPSVIRSMATGLTASDGYFLATLVPQRSGGWLRIHATRVHSSSGDKTTVVLEPVKPAVLSETVARVYVFTPREREVITCMARGMSSKEIAEWLKISPHTVNDHTKSVFRKSGVQSRQQLIAALFFDHCLPLRQDKEIPGPYGWFLDRRGADALQQDQATDSVDRRDGNPAPAVT